MVTERFGGEDFSQLDQIRVRQPLPHVNQHHALCIGESKIYSDIDQVLIRVNS